MPCLEKIQFVSSNGKVNLCNMSQGLFNYFFTWAWHMINLSSVNFAHVSLAKFQKQQKLYTQEN
jgi:hypothetical protein